MTDSATPRRLYYHGWNIVAVAILSCVAANGLPINGFALFLPAWSQDLHAPISTLQLGLASLGLFSALLSPFIGILADKMPARLLLISGLFGLIVMYIGLSFITELWQYFALYAIVFPLSLVLATNIPSNAAISRWFVKSRGLALGLASFGLGAAGVILPPIIAAVEPTLGWRNIWRIGGVIIAIIVIPAVFFVVRERPTEKDGLDYLAGEAGAAMSHHGGGGKSDDKIKSTDVLTRKNFWLIVFAFLPMLALYGSCSNNIAPIATSRGLSQQVAGNLLAAMSLTQLVASLTVGMLSDKIGNRLPLFGLAALASVGGLCIAFGPNLEFLTAGMILIGLGASFWPLVSSAIATEFGVSAFGRAFGLATLFLPLIALAPFTVAKVHEITGDYAPGIVAITALSFVGGCTALFMREKRGQAASA